MDSGGPLASCFDEGGRAFSVSQEDSSAEAVGWRRSADLDRASEAERGSSTRSTPTSSGGGGGGVPLAPADPFVTIHERLHYPKDATDAHKEPGMR